METLGGRNIFSTKKSGENTFFRHVFLKPCLIIYMSSKISDTKNIMELAAKNGWYRLVFATRCGTPSTGIYPHRNFRKSNTLSFPGKKSSVYNTRLLWLIHNVLGNILLINVLFSIWKGWLHKVFYCLHIIWYDLNPSLKSFILVYFRSSKFKNFLQPWWRYSVINMLKSFILEHLRSSKSKIFFNHGEDILW